MREHEMRERIERLVRMAAVPARVGITMTLLACSCSDGAVPDYASPCPPDGCFPSYADAGQSPAKDAAPDSPAVTPLYMAQIPDAGATDASDATDDGTVGAVPDYMALMPDAG